MVLASADLSITKSDDVDPVIPSETLTYAVLVANPSGPFGRHSGGGDGHAAA